MQESRSLYLQGNPGETNACASTNFYWLAHAKEIIGGGIRDHLATLITRLFKTERLCRPLNPLETGESRTVCTKKRGRPLGSVPQIATEQAY